MNLPVSTCVLAESDPLFWWIMGTVAVLAVGSPVVKALMARRRAADAEQDVAVLGFAGIDDTDALLGRLSGLPLIERNERREIRHAMTGQHDGVDVIVFEFTYHDGSLQNAHEHQQTVVAFVGRAVGGEPFAVGGRHGRASGGLAAVLAEDAKLCVEADGDRLIVYRNHKVATGDRLVELLDRARQSYRTLGGG